MVLRDQEAEVAFGGSQDVEERPRPPRVKKTTESFEFKAVRLVPSRAVPVLSSWLGPRSAFRRDLCALSGLR